MRKNKKLHRRAYNLSDRKLRELVFRQFADSEYMVKVEVMNDVFNWIKRGALPEAGTKPRLEVVKGKCS